MSFSERIQFRCPGCTLIIDAGKDEVGGKVGCRFCGKVCEVPMRSVFAVESTRVAEPAARVMTTDDGLTVIVPAPPPVAEAQEPPPLPSESHEAQHSARTTSRTPGRGRSRQIQGLDVVADDEAEAPAPVGNWACPYCQHTIHPDAKRCHSCRRVFPDGVWPVQRSRSPGAMGVFAAFLSLFWPGLGHLARGRILSGIMWMVLVPLGYIMLLVPGLFLHLACIVNAYRDDGQ